MMEEHNARYHKNVDRGLYSVAELTGYSETGKILHDNGETYIGEMDIVFIPFPDGQGKMISADGAVKEGLW